MLSNATYILIYRRLLWQKDRAMIDLSRLKSAVASQQGGSAFVGYGYEDANK